MLCMNLGCPQLKSVFVTVSAITLSCFLSAMVAQCLGVVAIMSSIAVAVAGKHIQQG